MGRRSGFGGLINAVARDFARAQREQQQQQRAYERAVQRQQRAHAAYTKQAERDAKRLYLEDQIAAAAEQTATIAATIRDLDSILAATLTVDDRVDFAVLRLPEEYPAFAPPAELCRPFYPPAREIYFLDIQPPGAVGRLVPGAEARHQEKLRIAEAAYQRALAEQHAAEERRVAAFQAVRREYDQKRTVSLAKAAERNAEVAELESAYYAGNVEAIVTYNSMVLDRSLYPDGFPQVFRIAYKPESRELVVDYELPRIGIIPPSLEVRYIRTRDAFEEKPRKTAGIRERYQRLIASVALRTIHEIFEADQGNHIGVVTFSGYVEAVDVATGQDIKPYLISVRSTRAEFARIDLARVEPGVCIRNLGASVSASAGELIPIKPIIEFNMIDPRFVEQSDILGQLDARPNIMDLTPVQFENLVGNVFSKMGLETKLTRSSRDGGVDVVAYDTRPVLGGRVVIQAKRYRNTVGVSAVRDLFGTMMNEGANKGILVTTSGYGADAFTFARDKPIELIDGNALLFLCEQVGVRARIIMPSE